MSAPSETTPPSSKAGLYFDAALLGHSLLPGSGSSGERVFKKHKVLPHPRNTRPAVASRPRAHLRPSGAINLSPEHELQDSSPHSLKHHSQRLGEPDLPPTPPTQSRASSSIHSIYPSSQTYTESPEQSETSISTKIPTTPPNQRSPPTPDVTPPQPTLKLRDSLRPALKDRVSSKATTESRSESFTTARETPYLSEEDDHATPRPRPALPEKASASTVRQIEQDDKKTPQVIESGPDLDSHAKLTPKTKQEFFTFDGDWASSDEVVEQEWDDNLNRHVMVRKRAAQPRTTRVDGSGDSIDKAVEAVAVRPANATKALRPARLREPLQGQSPAHEAASRDKHRTVQSSSEVSPGTDLRRLSGMSTKSNASTVVEAILVDVHPQRQRTLRHVKKQKALRDSGSNFASSPSNSTTKSVPRDETARRPRASVRPDPARPESFASSSTAHSLTSRKARREVWKNGGIPVVVIPDRSGSLRSKEAPSLRSNSSRRSQRSTSMGSAPISDLSQTKDLTPYFDRPSRRGRPISHRGRTMSESDRSHPFEMEQLTMDYPPVVPVRSSSLSAPTSRHASAPNSHAGSRAGSLTAESLRAHNAVLQEQQTRRRLPKINVEHAASIEYMPPERPSFEPDGEQLQPVSTVESYSDGPDQRSLVDQRGDPFFGKRLTTHKAPFSQASVETNGTHGTHGTQFAAEVSEAMAVNIYAHQNTSVLMVNHTSRGADSNGLLLERPTEIAEAEDERNHFDKPEITTTNPDGVPITPPHSNFPAADVDSPLRNPRAPPEPPAIKFTPATPSGHTPAAEKMKMLGNYFEEVVPGKRPSLVKRALSLSRRHSDKAHSRRPSLLARTFSLSRNIRTDTAENPDVDRDRGVAPHSYPTMDDQPPDVARLHPNWRPASSHLDPQDDEDYVYDIPDEINRDYSYPMTGNHPPPSRRRSLSQRMKRTFAILPITDDKHYTTADGRGPERRTIRRTPSGSLRVVEHRDSYGSLRWPRSRSRSRSPHRNRSPHYNSNHHAAFARSRPSSAPDGGDAGRHAWDADKQFDTRGRRLFPGWQEKFEQYGLHNLQRRLSEKRRQKRTEALRQKISGPREVRDGVGEVLKRNSYKGPSYQSGMPVTGY